MRYSELFTDYVLNMAEDVSALNAAAEKSMISAKKQKKQAQIAALKDKTQKKQRELSLIGSSAV